MAERIEMLDSTAAEQLDTVGVAVTELDVAVRGLTGWHGNVGDVAVALAYKAVVGLGRLGAAIGRAVHPFRF